MQFLCQHSYIPRGIDNILESMNNLCDSRIRLDGRSLRKVTQIGIGIIKYLHQNLSGAIEPGEQTWSSDFWTLIWVPEALRHRGRRWKRNT